MRARSRGDKAGVIWPDVCVMPVECQKELSVYEMGERMRAKERGTKGWLTGTRT